MYEPQIEPLIVGFVADIYFSIRIEDVAQRLNFAIKWIEKAGDIAPQDKEQLGHQWGEPLEGREAVLLDDLSRWNPALIIFDLNNQEVPWEKWIQLITAVPATRRIPVLCFGSHREVEMLQSAKRAGADVVLSRSRFVDNLPDLIRKYSRVPDYEAIIRTCQEPLSEKAIQGLEEFNRGDYYEAHEFLEEAWMEDESFGRNLYQGVLQVGVAYYHILRGNYKGAAKLFLRLRQWLDPLPDTCRGVDVARLRKDAEKVHAELLALGPDRISEFDRNHLKPVYYVAPGE